MSSIEQRNDGWVNTTTGIGGPADKSSGYRFASSHIDQDWFALEELYEEDHIAGRIVDALPEAVFANGINVEIADAKQKEATLDKLDALKVEDLIAQGMKWERLYGGAAIFVGVDDGRRFDEPLVEDNVRQVLYLHVLERWELYPARHYEDPKSPKFGQPSHYRVSPSDSTTLGRTVGVLVHESRLIKFDGLLTTKRKLIENQYWGQSVLVRAYNAIKQYGGSLAAVLALASDASQGVYKIKGLLQIIEGGNEEALKERFRQINQLRSILKAVLLDADGEDYSKVATQLTELANIVDRFQVNVAAAANMPVTEIFGISAAGLNATGENDTRSWYKQVAKAQRKSAKPAFERILRLLFRSKLGPTSGAEPTSWSVKFPPAWSPTALEQEQIKKTKTERALLLKDAQVVNEFQIARGLCSGSEWDGDIVLTTEEIEALRTVSQLAGMQTQGGSASGFELAPTDAAKVVRVREARSVMGLAPFGDERDDMTMDELAAKNEADAEAKATVATQAAVTQLQQPAAVPDPQVTQDDQGEELAALNPRELATRMTELGVKRCEHGKSNRCQLCGVERHRELLDADGDGNGEWKTSWRAIGARAPAATEPDPSAADEADE